MNVRRHVIFAGRVQGVGFRYTVHRLAVGRAVAGYVSNLSDGSVEMVAEGLATEVDGLLAAIRGHFEENIQHADVTTAAPTGEFHGFEIRR